MNMNVAKRKQQFLNRVRSIENIERLIMIIKNITEKNTA